MFPVRDVHPLAPTITRLVVDAPLVARKHRPGHFVIVRVAEGGERIPLTVVESDAAAGTITLIVQAVGKTTRLVCGLGPGQALADVVGPLGSPAPIRHQGAVACVGGGVGAAVLYPIARALRAAGNEVHTILGARSAELLVLESEMAGCSHTLAVTTDDGSRGRRGLVTDALLRRLELTPGLAAVYAVGPLPMMQAVAELTRPRALPTCVSLNPIMIDGTGMCGGCRVTVGGQVRLACVDGPEFDAHQVDFGELMGRNRTYADLERYAAALHEGGDRAGEKAS
jgi:ferredoxin/flavodoxin---NADP+ reductase